MSNAKLDEVRDALLKNGLTGAVADWLTDLLARVERLEAIQRVALNVAEEPDDVEPFV